MNVIKEMRKSVGMSQKEFSFYFKIPLGTVQNWEQELCKCPAYVVELIRYKLDKEKDCQRRSYTLP
ncbi:MAG: transcriptional regulator [Ruminococcus sp.]|nr:transcriptional regulator [Ruminococcus sp.]